MSKYKIPVTTYVQMTKHAGYIECESFEEYEKILERKYNDFLDAGHISTNISNDFEVSGDLEICELEKEDIEWYKNTQK